MTRQSYYSTLFVLSLLGLLIAGYLISTRIGGVKLVCVTGSNCQAVQYSPYLNPFGISISWFGAAFYLIVLGLTVGLLQGRKLAGWVRGLGIFGLLFAGYVTYAQAVLIGQFCFWCIIQAINLTIIFAIGLILRQSKGTAT